MKPNHIGRITAANCIKAFLKTFVEKTKTSNRKKNADNRSSIRVQTKTFHIAPSTKNDRLDRESTIRKYNQFENHHRRGSGIW